MTYLRAASNGVVAEVIRERQHLHNIKGDRDSNVVIRPAGIIFGGQNRDGRQAATDLWV